MASTSALGGSNPTGPTGPTGKTLYEPLNQARLETRLLVLEPSADHASPMHCTPLRKSSLLVPVTGPTDPDIFEVLSYTWGNASIKKDIIVDG